MKGPSIRMNVIDTVQTVVKIHTSEGVEDSNSAVYERQLKGYFLNQL